MANIKFKQEWYELGMSLPKEIRIELFDFIVRRLFSDVDENELSLMPKLAFMTLKDDIQKSINIYHRNVVNGKKGGAPIGNTNAKQKQPTAKKQPKNNPDIINIQEVAQNETTQKQPKNNPKTTQKQPKTEENLVCARLSDTNSITTTSIIKDKEKDNIYILSKKKEKPLTKDELDEKLAKRAKKFYESLIPYLSTYGKEMLREFYDYWVEPNKSHTQMRFEMERTWSLSRRLGLWSRNNSKFNKQDNYEQKRADSDRRKSEIIKKYAEQPANASCSTQPTGNGINETMPQLKIIPNDVQSINADTPNGEQQDFRGNSKESQYTLPWDD